MANKINSILEEVLTEINPKEEVSDYMKDHLEDFLIALKKRIKRFKIECEPFVGGSYAKGTMIKKGSYDIDIFLRFSKKYSEEQIKKLTKKLLRKFRKVSKVHGSRDYFQIKVAPWLKFEIVPVMKVKKPLESKNITDLSYSHVNYINKKIKSTKILDQIKLSKAFAHATGTYGAESYVNGFSGYSLELLTYKYKTFENLLKELTKRRKNKIIIDLENLYKKPKNILIEMNGAKITSPIVLIDPTYKERNVAAALSDETFEKFKKYAKEFLKRPKKEMFFPKPLKIEEIKKEAEEKKSNFISLIIKTKKQNGDIAGTKLLKFYKHLKKEIERYFEIENSDFKYGGERIGTGFFVVKPKKEITLMGPEISDKKNVEKFKENHKKTSVKDGHIYSIQKIKFSISEFFLFWKEKNRRKIKEMYITKFKFK